MPWKKQFPAFERNFLALQQHLEISNPDEQQLHIRGRLLRLVIRRGWRMLQHFQEEDPALERVIDAQTEKVRLSLPGEEQEPQLNFSVEEIKQMEWEIREIIMPAFRELYDYFKALYLSSSKAVQS